MVVIITCAIVALILMTFFIENGEAGWGTMMFLAFLSVLFFIDKRVTFNDVAVFVRANTGYVITGAILYIMIGIAWTLIKWKWYCRDTYKKWPSTNIEASNNKSRLTGWMIWWPPSLAWFILHDPITNFYNFLYRKLSGVLNSISQSERSKVFVKKD